MTEYDDCVLPVQMEKNCYWGEAVSSGLDKNATVNSGFDADIQVIEKTDGWYLQIMFLKTGRMKSSVTRLVRKT